MLATLVFLAVAPKFVATQAGGRLTVREGDEVMVLRAGSWWTRHVPLSPSSTLQVDLGQKKNGCGDPGDATVRYGAQTLSLKALGTAWLDGDHDSVLGPHEVANEMRFKNSKGGLFPVLLDTAQSRNGALAVLTWKWDHAFGNEYLVRISTNPRLSLAPIRRISGVDTLYTPAQFDHFYRVGQKLLLLNGSNLESISEDGKPLSVFARVPEGEPTVTVAHRWLVLKRANELWSFDVQRRQARRVAQGDTGSNSTELRIIGSGANRGSISEMLLGRSVGQARETFEIVDVRSGSTKRLTGAIENPIGLSDRYIFSWKLGKLQIMDRKTGR